VLDLKCFFWNINGTSPQQLQLNGTLPDLRAYDILCLSETRHTDPSAFETFFPDYAVYHRAAERSVRGMGVVTLVSKRLRPHVRSVPSPNPHLQLVVVTILPPAVPHPTTVLNCYVPPIGSPQLGQLSHVDTFQYLTQLCQQLHHSPNNSSLLVAGGDFNAHVSFLDDAPAGVCAVGDLLVGLAQNCDLQFSLIHDEITHPTFYAHRGDGSIVSSCPDHVLTSVDLPASTSAIVRLDVPGSDHRPITITLNWHVGYALPSVHLQPHYREGRLCWQGREADYCIEIQRAISCGSFDEVLQLLHSPDTAAGAPDAFVDLIRYAGVRSDHHKPPQDPSRALLLTTPKPVTHKPWFDAQCQQARTHYKYCLRHLPYGHPTLRTAARAYESLRRRKQREWSKQALDGLVAQALHNPRAFWKRFGSSRKPAPLAMSAADVDACILSLQSVFVSEDAPSSGCPPGQLSDSPEHVMNQPFTVHDVELVLGSLKNGLSCGSDGIPAEFLKYAVTRSETGQVQEYLLAPYLTQLFNHFFASGRAPASWCTALLSLVFKKGDKQDWRNYRPLAVTNVLAKVYALLLSKRLTCWAEERKFLTPAQVGFRPRHSTVMNNFVLLHLVDKCRAQSMPLYSCFLDFNKAYDRVVREHVWQQLHELGCQGKMLFAVASLYSNVTYSVKFANGASTPFHTNTGLRQGCPLSPFLFNLIMQKLWDTMEWLCPDTGPCIELPSVAGADGDVGVDAANAAASGGAGTAGGGGSAGPSAAISTAPVQASADGPAATQTRIIRVPALMYADDSNHLACKAHYSQSQLNAVELFMEDERMVAGMDKTKMLVFNATYQTEAGRNHVFKLGGRVVERVTEYDSFLGLLTKQQHTIAGMMKHVARRGQAAVAVVHRKVRELGVAPNASTMLLLFQAVVLPNLTFGCEVWGPWFLHTDFSDRLFDNRLERVRISFLRVLLGLKSSTPSWNVLREVGWYPLQLFVARQLVRWMNKLWSMPAQTIARCALMECWHLHFDGNTDNWCARLRTFFAAFGIQPAAYLPEDHRIPLYSERGVVAALQVASHKVYSDSLAGEAPLHELDSKLALYHVLFADSVEVNGPRWKRARYLNLPLRMDNVRLLARFRLSNHYLFMEVGRWRDVPVLARTCDLCGGNCVQNEQHLMFDCPALQRARGDFPRLFGQGHFTPQLRKLFGLHVAFQDQAAVAKDLCSFLQLVGGVYGPPRSGPPDG